MMKEFVIGMLGANDPHDFAHAFAWAMIGAVISLLLHAAHRDPNSPRTPVKFSLWFMLRDNIMRFALTVLLIIVVLRFCPDVTGFQLSGWLACLIGFANDKLAQLIKIKSGIFNTDVLKLPTMQPVCFPTIHPINDVLTAYNGVAFQQPQTGEQLRMTDGRFRLEYDDQNQPVLCTDIVAGDPMPTIEGVSFAPQDAEPFIGGRPARRRPRPI